MKNKGSFFKTKKSGKVSNLQNKVMQPFPFVRSQGNNSSVKSTLSGGKAR